MIKKILAAAVFCILTVIPCFSNQADNNVFFVLQEPVQKSSELKALREPSVCRMRELYLSDSRREYLVHVLYKSAELRPYIRAKLKSKKMPMILQYLPVVESSYKTTAVSVSGATGLWQFMENSVHPFLKITEYYDERLDPWKETDAAIAKLTDNYKMFNDWALALAAYNMGAGALKRVLKEHPHKTYWDLVNEELLPKQTADYVPKLVAIADIIDNADFYGLLDIGIAEKYISGMIPPKFKYAKIKGSLKLSSIAEYSGIDIETLKELNPSLLKERTPPNENYRLRLPPDTDVKEFTMLLKEGTHKKHKKAVIEQKENLYYSLTMIDTVIFDLDGTLLNTLEDLTDSVNASLNEYGFKGHTLEEVKSYVGNGLGKLIERAIPGGIENEHYNQVLSFMKDYYSKNCLNKTKPYDGVLELIDQLNKKGIKTAIVSNKPDPEVKELAKVFFKGIAPDFAVGESEKIKRKPSPDAVNDIISRLGSKKENTIYVGDSDVDFNTAKNAGVECISVTWGFKTREFLVELGAKHFADTPAEILNYLK